MHEVHVFTDGGARGNPGPAAYGVFIQDTSGQVLWKEGKTLGSTTNNVAEYSAILAALTWLVAHKEQIKMYERIAFFMDSELLCRQLTGLYKVKNDALKRLMATIKQKEHQLSLPFSYTHVRREHNKEADKLVNRALDNAV